MVPSSFQAESRVTGLGLPPAAALVGGLLAGLLVWALIQAVHPVFLMPEEFYIGMGSPADLVAANHAAQRSLDRQHAMLYVGVLGAALGLTLGIGQGLARRSLVRSVACSVPLGAVGGAVGGLLACFAQEAVLAHVGVAEIQHTAGVQLALCVPLACSLGLGLGLASRAPGALAKGVIAGLTAGLVAAAVYPLIIATAFPWVGTDTLLPQVSTSRLLWLGMLAGIIGLVIGLVGRKPKTAVLKAQETGEQQLT